MTNFVKQRLIYEGLEQYDLKRSFVFFFAEFVFEYGKESGNIGIINDSREYGVFKS